MSPEGVAALFILLISPAVGSFLGVLVDRLPEGRSILAPSHCAACQTRLRWAHLVPVVSALALRGRCGLCGAEIPNHLLRVELASIAAALAAALVAGSAAHLVLLALVLWCLVALFYSDLRHLRLPDALTAALFLLGLVWAHLDPARLAAGALATGLVTAAALYFVRWAYQLARGREGLGLGDVKLGAGMGALLGWELVPVAILVAAVLALLVALLEWARTRSREHLGQLLPFGSYLCGATVLLLLF